MMKMNFLVTSCKMCNQDNNIEMLEVKFDFTDYACVVSTERIDSVIPPANVSEEEIKTRAYYRWLEQGQHHGSDVDDWNWAEANCCLR